MNKFFVDAMRYETDQTALTGGEIKKLAKCSLNYHLFVETEETEIGQRFIGDGEAIRLDGDVRHFWVIPPATM
jgi:hypothetical protein